MDIDNVVENVDYIKTPDKNVIDSLETERVVYYKDECHSFRIEVQKNCMILE